MNRISQQKVMSLVLDHILTLSSVARSTREMDLRIKIKIISGYITMIEKMISSMDEGDAMAYDFLIRKLMMDPFKQHFVGMY